MTIDEYTDALIKAISNLTPDQRRLKYREMPRGPARDVLFGPYCDLTFETKKDCGCEHKEFCDTLDYKYDDIC